MIRIQILSYNPETIKALFYYEVPTNKYTPNSADPNREVLGTALTPPQVQDVKDGRLIEYYFSESIKGASYTALQQRLQAKWNSLEQSKLREYESVYAGTIWDGNTWS